MVLIRDPVSWTRGCLGYVRDDPGISKQTRLPNLCPEPKKLDPGEGPTVRSNPWLSAVDRQTSGPTMRVSQIIHQKFWSQSQAVSNGTGHYIKQGTFPSANGSGMC